MLRLLKIKKEREFLKSQVPDVVIEVKVKKGSVVDDFDDEEEVKFEVFDFGDQDRKDKENSPLLGGDMEEIKIHSQSGVDSDSETRGPTVSEEYNRLLNEVFNDDDLFRNALMKMEKAYGKDKNKTSGEFIKEMNMLARAKQLAGDSSGYDIDGKTQEEVADEFKELCEKYNESSNKVGQNIGKILTVIGVLALVAGFVLLGLSLGFAALATGFIIETTISLLAGGGVFSAVGFGLTLYHRPDTAARRLNKIEKMHEPLRPQPVDVM